MNSLPPPRLSGLAWRNLSKGVYAGDPRPLSRIEADLADDYDLADADVRPAVWEAAIGRGAPPTLHEIVLRYEAEASRQTTVAPRDRRTGASDTRASRGARAR
jgi:hypothetical protein